MVCCRLLMLISRFLKISHSSSMLNVEYLSCMVSVMVFMSCLMFSQFALQYLYIVLRCFLIRLRDIAHSVKTMSWSDLPIGGSVFVPLKSDGVLVNMRSRVRSPRVGLSTICSRDMSFKISISLWWCALSDLPGITLGIDQSMWPRLKSPPRSNEDFALKLIRLRDSLSWSRDSPLSDGGL